MLSGTFLAVISPEGWLDPEAHEPGRFQLMPRRSRAREPIRQRGLEPLAIQLHVFDQTLHQLLALRKQTIPLRRA